MSLLSEYVFSHSEIELLKEYRDKQTDHRLKLRFIALVMLSSSNIDAVADIIGKTKQTIVNWFDLYITKGIESLAHFNYKPKQPSLNLFQMNQVVIWVSFENPPYIKAVMEYIRDKFGIEYSHEGVRKLLKKKGLSVLNRQFFQEIHRI